MTTYYTYPELTPDTVDQLRALEERLLDPDVRSSVQELDTLLADSFREIGSSGRSYDRVSIIKDLKASPGFGGPRTISEFHADLLSPTVALVTYRIVESSTLRSSIWQLSSGRWRMVFHQGTPAKV